VDITLIPGHNPGPYTGAGNNTYLVRGRVPTLIDAATGSPRHLGDLESALSGETLAQVLVTHAHVDHASGVEALSARWPGASFRKMPWPERDAQYPVDWRAIADGDAVDAGDGRLRAIHTPGHAPDHLCFYDEADRVLFSADLVVARSTVVIPATHGGSLAQYLASLERVLALAPRRLLPAHGPAIENPAAILRAYLDHRRRREDQVVDALGAGARTPDAIVARIYDNLSPDLVAFARESVLAHLIKLEGEGRATRAGDDWTLL